MTTSWQPCDRYPDPAVVALDPSFERYRLSLARVERLGTGFGFTEGPCWFGDGGYLLFSDIPNDTVYRWLEATGEISVYRKPSQLTNGNTRDRQGRLVSCEHGTRRLTRTEYDGSITVLADHFEGRRLNSPNDVVVKSDGSIWFTDPPFGISNDYLGRRAQAELGTYVYRLSVQGVLSVVAEHVLSPNGLCFSPDEKTLYVVESRGEPHHKIVAFPVNDDGSSLGASSVLIDCGEGIPDGVRCDEDGNLWCGWGMGRDDLDGVRVFDPSGRPIGVIRLPERCANLCFGGRVRNRLFMAASRSLYALYVNTRGAI
ncbi:SMP-30/gluconolactonase/LRE family protein [Paraburkholderia sp. Ac-20342]|uniref:SMP-30/gluconolactonase/LRE family protein n=1 Tax=Paraburkholderia sp. Ac-20342 TaxID=2703889 RepID=UPI00197D1BA1|nr:SMP-30/gluconolactonase/LRE family protein [Paraburkholderia sp. Ac-20342]MBN3849330.1 SMP-30/gluconolactonase/LRE family protein [Paraburkholderia sp. Ac-20342]